jgi:hypothetical protein
MNENKTPDAVHLPAMHKTSDTLPANCSWDIDPETLKGRPLEEIRVTTRENATLLVFGARPSLAPGAAPEPRYYVGLRAVIRVDGDMGTVAVAAYTFPNGINAAALSMTNLLVPQAGNPPELREVIGLFCTGVFHNDAVETKVPPSVIANGFLFEFGELYIEVNTVGLFCHRPKTASIILQ